MLRSSHDACGCSTQTTSTINLKRSTLHPHEGQADRPNTPSPLILVRIQVPPPGSPVLGVSFLGGGESPTFPLVKLAGAKNEENQLSRLPLSARDHPPGGLA